MAKVELSGTQLVPTIVQDLVAGGRNPMGAAYRALQAQLFDRFSEAFGCDLIFPPKIRPEAGTNSGGPSTLPALVESGIDHWYLEIWLTSYKKSVVGALEIVGDELLRVMPFDLGNGINRPVLVKTVEKKTQTNRVVRINHLYFSGSLFQKVQSSLTEVINIQPLLPNFMPGPDINGFHVVSYDHMLSGVRAFCSCAQPMHRKILKDVISQAPIFAKESWPHKVIALLRDAAYLEKICHLCLSRTRSPAEAYERYGPGVEKGFESFIDQVMFDSGVDRKTARGEIHYLLGLSRWVREAELYGLVRELFKDQRILREASPEWLGRLRLDIYLPALGLAIEHQGVQHYQPVAMFGGDAGYARVVARDELKRQLCQANRVEVVDVRFDAPLTKSALRNRLKRYISD